MKQAELPWRIQRYATADSTQTLAVAAARDNEPGRLAILADAQTAGRGSRGRSWTAPRGNLNLSILLWPICRPDPGPWSLRAAIALHDALAPYTTGLLLKWPNDLLLHGNKLGGVLIDSSLDKKGDLEWVVVGVGANLAEAPAVSGRKVACLPPPCPDAAKVATAFLRNFDRWAEGDICAAWLDRAHPVGTMIDVVTPHRRVQGRFAGLSPRGELMLEGVATPICSAEVFVHPAGSRSQTAPCFSS